RTELASVRVISTAGAIGTESVASVPINQISGTLAGQARVPFDNALYRSPPTTRSTDPLRHPKITTIPLRQPKIATIMTRNRFPSADHELQIMIGQLGLPETSAQRPRVLSAACTQRRVYSA